MEAAKNAVSSFLGSSGKHHTDVDENVNPAVTSETVKPHRHEETQEAIDREVHRDHYHTTVQPVQAQETLPEQHQHNVVPQVEREFQHGNPEQDRARAGAELGQFQNTSTTTPTTQSTAVAPSVAGEHTHHHVHETVQPIIHKETIPTEVVHTTIPIHEKHIAPSEHHGLSELPVKNMDEFKNMGPALTGGARSHEEYDGHPRHYNTEMQKQPADVDIHPERHDGTHDPEKTGHFDHLHSGNSGSTGAAAAGFGAATAAGQHHDYQADQVQPGRETAYDYSTTATQQPSFGQTTGGMLTGAGDRYGPQGDSSMSSGLEGRDAAMGHGVANVAQGDVARDLGRDHTMAHEVTSLNRDDTSATFGDSGATTAGTALGGRAEGNTAGLAASAVSGASRDRSREPSSTGRNMSELSPAEQQGSTRERSREPSNLTGGAAEPPKNINPDDGVQHASLEGQDPSLEKERGGKLTGTGQDGSHSAVFGLTPDGHKFTDTKHHAGGSAHMPRAEEDANDRDPEGASNDPSSRGTGSERVADQLQDPRVAEKGHEGKAEYTESDAKPGAGTF